MPSPDNPNCFVICPIGEPDSDVRQQSDEVLKYLIQPTLRVCGFATTDVVRADDRFLPGSITTDVLTMIRDFDLCLIDVTGLNPNVMYECGLRHANGKPYVMMARQDQKLPFDIHGIRTLKYDLTSKEKTLESQQRLEAFIQTFIDAGFAREAGTDSIGSIAEAVRTIDAKVTTLMKGRPGAPALAPAMVDDLDQVLSRLNPHQAFNYAAGRNDIRLMENILPTLESYADSNSYLQAVRTTAAKGSKNAAGYIRDNWASLRVSLTAEDLYLSIGAYVSYCNRSDTEEENMQFVLEALDSLAKMDPDPDFNAGLYNQRQRMYFGVYESSDREKTEYLPLALQAADEAVNLRPTEPSFHYNRAMVLQRIGDLPRAAEAIDQCLAHAERQEEEDDDHLALAYRIHDQIGDQQAAGIMEKLQAKNPYLAELTRRGAAR